MVVGTRIIIPASHKSHAEEILTILPVTSREGAESPVGHVEHQSTPWINKVLILALVYIALLALLYYSQK